MLMEYRNSSRAFWRRHLRARGYFAAISSNVTGEVLIKYIEQQAKEPPDGDFQIDKNL
jgi:putative transposase